MLIKAYNWFFLELTDLNNKRKEQLTTFINIGCPSNSQMKI